MNNNHDGDDSDTPLLRYFVYGNYLDEVVMMRNVQDDDAYVDDKDFYFVHNHLFSPVALVAVPSLPWQSGSFFCILPRRR